MSWTNILYSQYLRTIYFLTNWDKFPSSTQLPSCGIFYKLECKHLLRLSTILQFSAMSELWLYGYVISFVVLFHVNMKMQINHWCFIGITHRNWPDWTNELEFEIQKLRLLKKKNVHSLHIENFKITKSGLSTKTRKTGGGGNLHK